MGYYVTILHTDAFIRADALGDAYTALKSIDGTTDWCGRTITLPDSCASVQAILDHAGFDTALEDDGLYILGYNHKTFQEEDLIAALAGHFNPGNYIHWRGEDDTQWRWILNEDNNGKLNTVEDPTSEPWVVLEGGSITETSPAVAVFNLDFLADPSPTSEAISLAREELTRMTQLTSLEEHTTRVREWLTAHTPA